MLMEISIGAVFIHLNWKRVPGSKSFCWYHCLISTAKYGEVRPFVAGLGFRPLFMLPMNNSIFFRNHLLIWFWLLRTCKPLTSMSFLPQPPVGMAPSNVIFGMFRGGALAHGL